MHCEIIIRVFYFRDVIINRNHKSGYTNSANIEKYGMLGEISVMWLVNGIGWNNVNEKKLDIGLIRLYLTSDWKIISF